MSDPMGDPMPVPIRDESIRLGQFLKLANLVESGAEARSLIADGAVLVNGEVDTRRGRQLVKGDVVSLAGQVARVSDESEPDNLPW
jgi:ribosome-associated protein